MAKKKLTKIDGVRQALGELGKDAGPTAIQAYLKERLGIDITKDHASTAKGAVLRQDAAKAAKPLAKLAAAKPPAKPAAAKPAAKPPMQPAAVSASAKGGGILLKDIETVKDLLGRVGPGELRKLIDLLAR
jgi:hypothetical protein